MSDLHVTSTNNKKSFPSNLKFFPLRTKYMGKYFFFFILVIILSMPLFAPKYIVPLLKAASSTSFTFTAGGDIGGNRSTSTALDLIAQSGVPMCKVAWVAPFHLNLFPVTMRMEERTKMD